MALPSSQGPEYSVSRPRRPRKGRKSSADKTGIGLPRYGGRKSPPIHSGNAVNGAKGSSHKKKRSKAATKIPFPHISETTSDFFEEDDASVCSLQTFQHASGVPTSVMAGLKLGDYIFHETLAEEKEVQEHSALPTNNDAVSPSLTIAKEPVKKWPLTPKLPVDSQLLYLEPWLPPDWPLLFVKMNRSSNSNVSTTIAGHPKKAVTSRGLVDLDETDPCLPDR